MQDGAWDLWTDEVFETGLRASWLAAAGLLIAAAVPGWAGHDVGFVIAVLVGAIPAILLAPQAIRHGLIRRFGSAVPVLWSVVVVLAVTGAVAATGGPTSPVVLGYALPIVYFSTLYPGRTQLGLLLFLAGCYAGLVVWSGEAANAGQVGWYGIVLGVLAYLAKRLSEQIRTRHDREAEAEALAVRRAELIHIVARTGDQAGLDTDEILEELAEAARDLGMECVALFEIDYGTVSYSARCARGFTDDLTVPRPLDDGVVTEVVRTGGTVCVEAGDGPLAADPLVRSHGLTCLVAVPIQLTDRVSGVLVAGTRNGGAVRAELLEAFELLAMRAENVLGHAKRHRTQSQMLERQREIDRMKDDFIATASHELRTPVTIVKAASELLRTHWPSLDEERRMQLVDRLNHHVERLDRVVHSLTTFRQLKFGDREVELRPVPLGSQLVAVVDRWLDPEGPVVKWKMDDEVDVLADPQLLQIGLGELVENVATHTDSAVTVTARAGDDHAMIVISDDGPGLPDNVLDDLRVSFRRGGVADRSATGGLGLGLATAMTAFELLGVEVGIDSRPGGGTRWMLRLDRPQAIPEIDEVSSRRDQFRG